MKPFKFSFFILFFFSFVLFSCSGGGGSGSSNTGNQETYITGKVILGNLANATVEIFHVKNDGSLELKWTEITSDGDTLNDIGNFNTHADEMDNNELYIYQATGGTNWDVDDNGIKDDIGTPNNGIIRAVVVGKEAKEAGNSLVISYLTELQYRYLAKNLKYSFDKDSFLSKRDAFIEEFIKDIDNDGSKNQKDVLSFNPQLDKNKLPENLKKQVNHILDSIQNNKFSILETKSVVGHVEFFALKSQLKKYGNYAYISHTDGLTIVNVKNPSKPINLSTYYENFRTDIKDIVVQDNYVFISEGYEVDVIDTKNKQNPIKVTTINSTDEKYIYGLAIKNNKLYFGTSNGLLEVVDISNPKTPQKVGELQLSTQIEGTKIDKIKIKGNYAYIIQDSMLTIVDITNPKSPEEVSSTFVSSVISDIEIYENYVYSASQDEGLVIIDVSDKTQPQKIQTLTENFLYPTELKVIDNKLYVLDTGIKILDLSTPDDPFIIQTISSSSIDSNAYEINSIDVSHYLYVMTESGLYIVTTKQFANPSISTKVNLPPKSVSVYNNYAFIAGYKENLNNPSKNKSSLFIVDLHDLRNLSTVKTINTNGLATDVFIKDDYAYLSDEKGGLKIINISNPPQAEIEGNYNEGTNSIIKSYIKNNTAYVCNSSVGLSIIDVSKKDSPILISNVVQGTLPIDVFANDNYAYLLDSSDLVVIDISDKTNPVKLKDYYILDGYEKEKFFIKNNKAFIVAVDKLIILDISDYNNIKKISDLDFTNNLNNIYIEGNYAYILTKEEGFYVVDISNPQQPKVLDFIQLSGYNTDIFVDEDYVYITNSVSGLTIIDLNLYEPLHEGKLYTKKEHQSNDNNQNDNNNNGNDNNNTVPKGTVLLGNIANATVNIYRVETDGTLSKLWTEITSNGAALEEIGKFNLHLDELNDNDLYLYESVGGTDWDVDDDGIKDTTGTTINGKLRALVYGNQIKNIKEKFTISYITELQYRYLSNSLTSITPQKLNNLSKKIFIKDINKDGLINHYDSIVFNPKNDENKIDLILKNKLSKLKNSIINNTSFKPKLSPTIKIQNNIYGDVKIIAQNDYLYIISYSDIKIFDKTNINNISEVGSITINGFIDDAALNESYLYLAKDFDGFEIIDISDPSNPIEKGSIDFKGIEATKVKVKDNYAFVAVGGKLRIIDVLDPENPIEISSITQKFGTSAIEPVGDYLYLAEEGEGIDVVNIQDIYNPVIVSKYKFSEGGTSIKNMINKGNYLFAEIFAGNSTIFDITDKQNLKKIKEINGLRKFTLFKNNKFIVGIDESANEYDFTYTFAIYNIENINSPEKVGKFKLGNGIEDISGLAFDGKYLYILSSSKLAIVDMSLY